MCAPHAVRHPRGMTSRTSDRRPADHPRSGGQVPVDARPPLLPGHALGLRHAALGVVAMAVTLVAGLVMALLMLDLGGGEGGSWQAGLLQLLLMGGLAVLVVRLLRGHRYRPADLGLVHPSRPAHWVLAVVGAVVFSASSMIGVRVLPGLREATEQSAGLTPFGVSLGQDLAFLLMLTVAAPLAEELLYRGLIFRGLHDGLARRGGFARRVAFAVAAVVSALLFAVSHSGDGQEAQLPFLVLYGLIAAFLYWWTGSLLVPVLAHSLANLTTAFYTVAGEQSFTTPVVGVVAVLGPVLALGLLWLLRRALGGLTARA